MKPHPLLGTRMDRLRGLAARLRPDAALPALDAALQLLFARFEAERHRYSEIFEWSYAWDGAADLARFSYAFPGWRAAPDEVAGALARLVAPWGPAAEALCARVTEAARHPAVEQPLFGLAARPPRGKLYLQLRDEAGPAAEALAARFAATRPGADARLHMLGLDFGAKGLDAVKRYEVARAPVSLPGLPPLPRALQIHRAAPGGGFTYTDVDFGLADNGLDEAALFASPWAAAHAAGLAPFHALRGDFRLLVRRVSVGLAAPRFTLYYVLAETE